MSNPVSDFIDQGTVGDGHPSYKFPNIGDQIVGTIMETPRVVEVVSKFNQQLQKNLVLAVKADDDGETYSLWAKERSFMLSAIKEALTKANVAGLEIGGRIQVKFVRTQDTGKGNPAKVYDVGYRAPVAPTVGVDDLL